MLLCTSMFAQEKAQEQVQGTLPKESFLPKTGDMAIGFTLDPIAAFVGNMFNGSTDNKLEPLHGSGLDNSCVSIMMKYMLTDNFALKGNVGLIISVENNNEYVVDDVATALDPLSLDKVLDSKHTSNYGGSISFGAEYRVGKRKVQGIFGGGVLYSFQSQNTSYTYGNGITDVNQAPSSAFAQYETYSTAIPQARIIEDYNASGTHTVGLYGSVGVEWFVAPKISLGADVNLCLLYTMTPNIYSRYEGYNIFTGQVEERNKLISPMDSYFEFSIRNIGANLFISFYF